MDRRFAAIWFSHLTTDWMIRCQPALRSMPFVLAAPEHGRMVVKAANAPAQSGGSIPGMVVADCRAILPGLQVFDDKPGQAGKLLNALAEWCLRYTPVVAVDPPDGLILDISGCAHLWGGEAPYLAHLLTQLRNYGYHLRAAIADTIGTAWALSRYGQEGFIVPPGEQATALLSLPPAALRLDTGIVQRLEKLGFCQAGRFMHLPRAALRRRFGEQLLKRLDQALGRESEAIQPLQPAEPYQERLACLEPILRAAGIEIALRKLLTALTERLEKEGKGLRSAVFKAYRVDGNIQQIAIATTRASRDAGHLFKLFEIKIPHLEPDLGFELFMLEAPVVEELSAAQRALWETAANPDEKIESELLDKVTGRLGAAAIHRYLPDEHYWPKRAFKSASSLQEQPTTAWPDRLRPVHLLPRPEPISVTAPIPDYPPMLFIYQGKIHPIKKADGPERIEREWWIEKGLPRDYYCVEDEEGARYWLFRSGHYDGHKPEWFIHGFFA